MMLAISLVTEIVIATQVYFSQVELFQEEGGWRNPIYTYHSLRFQNRDGIYGYLWVAKSRKCDRCRTAVSIICWAALYSWEIGNAIH